MRASVSQREQVEPEVAVSDRSLLPRYDASNNCTVRSRFLTKMLHVIRVAVPSMMGKWQHGLTHRQLVTKLLSFALKCPI